MSIGTAKVAAARRPSSRFVCIKYRRVPLIDEL
jgi:hypothetical protein